MQELLHGAASVCLYILPAAAVMLTARWLLKIPDELFRKILHFILLGIYIPFLFAFETWWISAAFAAALMVVIYPCLALAGRLPSFSSFVNERKTGEFKNSMVLALSMIVISICICWGWLGDKLLTDVLAANRAGVPALMVEPAGGAVTFWQKVLHTLQKPFKALCPEDLRKEV